MLILHWTAPEVYRVALCDLLTHGDVVDRHQDGALVDVASDRVWVTAVVDQRQTGVDRGPDPLKLESLRQFVNLMRIVSAGTNNLDKTFNASNCETNSRPGEWDVE